MFRSTTECTYLKVLKWYKAEVSCVNKMIYIKRIHFYASCNGSSTFDEDTDMYFET